MFCCMQSVRLVLSGQVIQGNLNPVDLKTVENTAQGKCLHFSVLSKLISLTIYALHFHPALPLLGCVSQGTTFLRYLNHSPSWVCISQRTTFPRHLSPSPSWVCITRNYIPQVPWHQLLGGFGLREALLGDGESPVYFSLFCSSKDIIMNSSSLS